MDNIFLNFFAIMQDRYNYEDRKVARDIVGNYTIDTAFTSDYGYETAIWKDDNTDNMIIVERYDNKLQSEEGHKKWCKFCENKPKTAYSVQIDEKVEF